VLGGNNMHVIEYGHIKPREVKCSHCEAILAYTDADFTWMSGLHIWAVRCPVCGNYIKTDDNGKPFDKEVA
jgi:ribosomal protein S27E